LNQVGDQLGRGSRRAFVIASLAVAMALGILPMVSIGVLAPFLIDDLDISRADLGVLVAVVAAVSAVLSPLAGALVDRIGDRGALLAVLGTGALSLGLMAAARTFLAMSAAVALAGLCRAGANPATNRLISTRLPRGRRGWITGVKQSGETIAIVLAAAALPAAAVVWDWRALFVVLGIAAAMTALGAAISIEGTRRTTREPSAAGGRMPRSIRWLNAYNLVMGAGTGAIIAYLPLYAHEVGGLGDAAAGAVMVAAGLAGGISRLLWSHWSESRWGFPDSMSGLAGVALAACAVLLAAPHIGPAAYWIGAAIWGIGGLGFGAVSMLAAMAEASDASTGRASGLVVFWFSLGFTVSPPAFGYLLERSDTYGPGLFLLAGLYGAAAAIMRLSRKTFRPAGAGLLPPSPEGSLPPPGTR
jgi:predicted MFS family arabinose efflux permease